MDSHDVKHSSGILGSLGDAAGVLKKGAKDYLWLGVGAAAAISLTDFALSKLMKDGKPLIPQEWSPVAIAVMSIAAGELTRRKFGMDLLGEGMIAGGVGVAASALAAKYLSPAVAATTANSAAAETTGPQAATAGFGFGRAFASGSSGFSGLGRALPSGRQTLFSVGTPDMRGAGMFAGSTVAFEENGQMAGSTVQFEEDSAVAGILN